MKALDDPLVVALAMGLEVTATRLAELEAAVEAVLERPPCTCPIRLKAHGEHRDGCWTRDLRYALKGEP